MAKALEDYALIGNTRTAALISRDGSVDWFCAPRFDSPATFSALIGTPADGCWVMRPVGACHASRSYRGDTLVLETRYRAPTGVAAVLDFMPVTENDLCA
ncbi:MAG TPA: glycoside hydrolase family 15 protein, partial [Rhodospirillaceae bacterium]|nr:glycoside hydrolase family 15 protein [Rhodospirillaceae bacterium]